MASRSVEENIRKARKSLWKFGCISRRLEPPIAISTRSIIETCVMPVLLFGCENWILSKTN